MLKGIWEAFSLRPKASTSQIFVTLNVTDTMRTSGLSRQSTREIIRVSIGSIFVIGFLFLIIYTILLAYVDNRFRPSADDDFSWRYKKVKFVGKRIEPFGTDYQWLYEVNDKKAVWNAKKLYREEVLPHCRRQSLFRILITSAPVNKNRRQEIRKTWCQPGHFNESVHSWQCVFLISHSASEHLNKIVKEESQIHQDILLGTYVDSYRNLTLKVIHGLDWAANHCPSSFIVKTDDDCFVNSGVIHDFLLNHNKIGTYLYAGSFVTEKEKLRVIRGEDSKWSVPYADFPNIFYPPYASGIGYILSLDSVKQFIHHANYIKPIGNEDAYVGIVMSHIGIQPTISSRFLLSASGLSVCNFLYVMIAHDVQAEKQMEVMQKVLKSKTVCKNVDTVNSWS